MQEMPTTHIQRYTKQILAEFKNFTVHSQDNINRFIERVIRKTLQFLAAVAAQRGFSIAYFRALTENTKVFARKCRQQKMPVAPWPIVVA